MASPFLEPSLNIPPSQNEGVIKTRHLNLRMALLTVFRLETKTNLRVPPDIPHFAIAEFSGSLAGAFYESLAVRIGMLLELFQSTFKAF